MYKNTIQCSLGCLTEENQKHIFEDYIPVREKFNLNKYLGIMTLVRREFNKE